MNKEQYLLFLPLDENREIIEWHWGDWNVTARDTQDYMYMYSDYVQLISVNRQQSTTHVCDVYEQSCKITSNISFLTFRDISVVTLVKTRWGRGTFIRRKYENYISLN